MDRSKVQHRKGATQGRSWFHVWMFFANEVELQECLQDRRERLMPKRNGILRGIPLLGCPSSDRCNFATFGSNVFDKLMVKVVCLTADVDQSNARAMAVDRALKYLDVRFD